MPRKASHTNPTRMRFFIELYSFIHKWKKENEQPPSVRDLFEFRFEGKQIRPNPSTARLQLIRMEELGMIERKAINATRTTLKLLPPSEWNEIVREQIKDGESWD